jgi:hypothetical protein
MAEDENVNPGGIDSGSGQGNENMNDEFMVSVFKTDNIAIIAVIKSILDEAGIKYMAKGDTMQGVYPINIFPVEFMVMPEDEAYAKELLSEIDEESDWYDENSPDDSGENTTEGDKPADENV